MERAASLGVQRNTYRGLGEEDLRNILLAHLNGHYEGAATGETFRKDGKTDIRIEDGNRAAFVAECRLWRGSAGVSAALDQLLSYLTWRDAKAALIIFNKQAARFAEILAKMPDVLHSHRLFRKILERIIRANGGQHSRHLVILTRTLSFTPPCSISPRTSSDWSSNSAVAPDADRCFTLLQEPTSSRAVRAGEPRAVGRLRAVQSDEQLRLNWNAATAGALVTAE